VKEVMSTNERWKVADSFGEDAISAVLGPGASDGSLLSDEELRAIARASSIPYWTDGRTLWSVPEFAAAVPGTRPITALEALLDFGLDKLADAREFGSTA
jgi:hypothetical protein